MAVHVNNFSKAAFVLVGAFILGGCATYSPAPNSPQIVIHAPESKVKNYLVNDLVNHNWMPATDSEFTIVLDKPGGFLQNLFFGSQWNPNTATQAVLTFIDTGDGVRVIWHEIIVTNPDSGFQQQTEITGDWPQVQFWLNCMCADLENRPRPPQPVFPPPQPVSMKPKTS
jgi:hypothetical protein